MAPAASRADWPAPRALDPGRLASAGVRVVESDWVTLVTDLPASSELEELARVVDRAVPQWAERFRVASPRLDGWRLRVYLIREEARFRSLGLWPQQSPDFPHGLSLGYEVWLRQQASDYYRRHLLLHEGTHSFMSTLLGSCGPGWYMEGMAELCGTHAWDGQTLRLAEMPPSRDAAPDWGRVRLVRDAAAPLSVAAVMKIDNRRVLPPDQYAWVWAVCWFLDTHPSYRERFAELGELVNDGSFNERVRAKYGEDARRVSMEWRLFASTLVYGHDLQREAIDFRRGTPLAVSEDRRVAVLADRGWQSSGVLVEAGQAVRLKASGRYVIGREPDGKPWPCEPGGITLAWNRGQPVGRLLATVDAGAGALIRASPIGLAGEFVAPASGTLYLRVNDSPNSLADNSGELAVSIRAQPR